MDVDNRDGAIEEGGDVTVPIIDRTWECVPFVPIRVICALIKTICKIMFICELSNTKVTSLMRTKTIKLKFT